MNKHIRFVGLIIIAFSLALISSNAWASTIELVKEKEHNPAALCYQGGAHFFDGKDFLGNKFELNSGFGDTNVWKRNRRGSLDRKNWHAPIKSLKIEPCTQVIMYRGQNFSGNKIVYSNSKHNEWREINYIGDKWNGKVGSVKVLPYCGTDPCIYTEEELDQLNTLGTEDKNQRLFDFVSALSGEWGLSRSGKNYRIKITAKKNSSEFTARYSNLNNPSTFSGNVWFDSNDTPNIKFTQYDSSTQFTAIHNGKQVKKNRFEGDFSDNRGSHGVSFVLWR